MTHTAKRREAYELRVKKKHIWNFLLSVFIGYVLWASLLTLGAMVVKGLL
jgi:hypothetical protein